MRPWRNFSLVFLSEWIRVRSHGIDTAATIAPLELRPAYVAVVSGRWSTPILLALAIAVSLVLVDLPLAAFIRRQPLPDGIDKFLEATEHFGTFYGHVLIFVLILALDPGKSRVLLRLGLTAWSAGLAANLVKLVIARSRPKYFDFDAINSGHGFLGLAIGMKGGSRIQGFPSAHTATAVGFAIALGYVYPRGRKVFLTFAALVGLQRISTSSHFASDVFAGALVGWLIAQLFVPPGRVPDRLATWEAQSP